MDYNNLNGNIGKANSNSGEKEGMGKTKAKLSSVYKGSKLNNVSSSLVSLCCNRTTLVPLILSVMVLLVGLSSLTYITTDVSLFAMFALVHSVYVIRMLYTYNKSQSQGNKEVSEYICV